MRLQLSDTNPKVEKALISLIRKQSISKRLSQFVSLTSLTLQLSKRAIARKHPEMNSREVNLLFVKYHYGEDFYSKIKQYLLKLPDEKK
ncbi:MAG: hypothetical protein A2068_08155 [Ignavibacteria bacterium GWB2_35_6b]|nr:MAG: hypothetical protein A2068_08155 [Ignavibacteria bacterium GWB2_35_6b]